MSRFDPPPGPFAYPWVVDSKGTEQGAMSPGLTTREHYAGLAMQGLLANETTTVDTNKTKAHYEMRHAMVARASVEYADALLAELAKAKP